MESGVGSATFERSVLGCISDTFSNMNHLNSADVRIFSEHLGEISGLFTFTVSNQLHRLFWPTFERIVLLDL